MVQLSIKADFKNVQRSLNALSDDLQKRVVPAALNKVIAKAKTEMKQQIASEFNLKSAEVADRLRVIKAGRALNQWSAVLDPFASRKRGRSLNVIRFLENKVTLANAKRRAKAGTLNQLHFQIKRVGEKKIIDGAFIGNKGRTVFVRSTGARLPIKPLTTIDVPQMFNTKRIQKAVISRIESEMQVEFTRAINAAVTGAMK